MLDFPSSPNIDDAYTSGGRTWVWNGVGWAPTGAVGPTGEQGPQGPAGDQGPTGDKGPDGNQGPVGDKGPDGNQGPAGDQGPPGDPATATATLTDQPAASDLPATGSATLTALLQTVRNCLKWLVSNTVQLTGAQTVAGVKTFSSRSSHAGAYTPAAQPTHSATPTFDCAVSNVFEPAAMTGNVTSITLSNPAAGQTVQIRFQQDATGGRTCAVPSGAKVDGSINTGANRVSWLILTYSGRASRFEGNWLVVPT